MTSPIRRIALSTGGGDAPGLNAVIRAATLASLNRGWEVVGIRDGFNGLFRPELYPEGGLINLGREDVRGIVHLGGTILGTTNRGNPTAYPTQQADGSWVEVDRSPELLAMFEKQGIDALITIGGRDAALRKLATAAAKRIGVVEVDHGDTACATPDAVTYIAKLWERAKKFESPAAAERARESMRTRC